MDRLTIFLVAGLGTVPVAIYVVCLIPQATVRCVVWILSMLFYRVRVRGLKNLPETRRRPPGRQPCFVAGRRAVAVGFDSPHPHDRLVRLCLGLVDQLADQMWGVIPIRSTDGPKALLRSLDAAKEALLEGDLVCIFAEGGITRTGQLQPFQRGLLRIVDGTGCPVIPVYLDELWGSIFSYSGGRFFWKMASPLALSHLHPVR